MLHITWEDLPEGALPILDKVFPGDTWVWDKNGPRVDTNEKMVIGPLCKFEVKLPCRQTSYQQLQWALGDTAARLMAGLLDASEQPGDFKMMGRYATRSMNDPIVQFIVAVMLTPCEGQDPWPLQGCGKVPSIQRVLKKMKNVAFRDKLLHEVCIWEVMEQ